MALFELVKSITLPVEDPGGGNTLPQYSAVVLGANGIDQPAAVTDQIAGIVLESVSKAEFDAGKVVATVAPLIPGSIIPMVANTGTIAVGDPITFVNTSGRGTDVAAAAGQLIIGTALTAAGAAGDIFSVLVTPADHG